MVGAIESCYNDAADRYNKEWFSDTVLVDFEGLKFKAPIGYHEVLTAYYGDYMKLPPEDQRECHLFGKIIFDTTLAGEENEKI